VASLYGASADNIYKDPRGSGVFFVRLSVRGRRLKRSLHTTNIAVARVRAAKLATQLRDQAAGWAAGESPTWDQWLASVQDSYMLTLRPRSRAHYAMVCKHPEVVRMFARQRLSDITPHDCQRLVGRLGRTLAPGTLRTRIAVLSAIFGWAVKAKELQVNPWVGLARPESEHRDRVMTLDEQRTLVAGITTPWFKRYFWALLASGLRAEELLELRVDGIRWDDELLDLEGKGGKRRQVPLLPQLAPILREQLPFAKKGRLFPYGLTTQWGHFTRLGRRTGIEGITAHVLRHTFATRWVEAGEDIYVLSKILGHASVKITERIYVHAKAQTRIAPAKRMAAALGLPALPAQVGKVLEFPGVAPEVAPTATGTE
jgi:integrase